MAADIGIKVGVDGEANFKKSLQNITAQAKALSAEMAAVTSAFDENMSEQKKAKAQLDTVTKQYETAKSKVALLTDEYKKVADVQGENSTEALKLKASLNKATAEMNSLKNTMDDTATKSSKLKTKFEELKEGAGDKLKSGLKGIASATGEIAKGVGVAAAAFGAAVVKMTKDAVEAYSEFEQLKGGIETLFGDEAAKKVTAYANNAYKTAGLSANEYMETVTGFSASLISSLGGDTAKATEVANRAVIDMSDNANKMGTDISSIQNAYQGFAKQNYTMLDNLKLGYGGTQAEMQRLLEDAEKFSGVKYDIKNFSDVAEAIHVIQSEMGITGATAKEASTTIQGSVGAMKSAYKNFVTGLADENADIKKLAANLIDSVTTMIKNIIPVIERILPNIVTSIQAIIPMIIEVLPGMLKTLLPDLIKTVTSAIKAVAETLPELVDTIIDFFVDDFIPTIISFIPQLMTTMTKIILSLVDALTNGDNLEKMVTAAIQIDLAIIKGLIQAIPQIVSRIPQIIRAIVNALKDGLSAIASVGGNLVRGLWNGISDKVGWIVGKIRGFGSQVIASIKGIFGIHSPSRVFRGIGQYLDEGLALGIKDKTQTAVNAVSAMSRKVGAGAQFGFEVQTNTSFGSDREAYLVGAFKAALADMSVEMDGKQLGKFVNRTITKAVYG